MVGYLNRLFCSPSAGENTGFKDKGGSGKKYFSIVLRNKFAPQSRLPIDAIRAVLYDHIYFFCRILCKVLSSGYSIADILLVPLLSFRLTLIFLPAVPADEPPVVYFLTPKHSLTMKRLFVCFSLSLFLQATFAQSEAPSGRLFKPFKVDISAGYASPQTSAPGAKFNGGGLFAIEPKWAVIDALAIGLRVEAAITAHVYDNGGNSNSSKGNGNLSYILTLDYYFTKTKFRPFIGAGAGIYTTAALDSNSVSSGIGSIPATSQFGSMVRAGFELGHLRLAAEYNFVANSASYLGLKLGLCIGGGRRK